MDNDRRVYLLTLLRKAIRFNTGKELSLEELRNVEDPIKEIHEYQLRNSSLPMRFKVPGKKQYDEHGMYDREDNWTFKEVDDELDAIPESDASTLQDPNHVKRKIF